MQREKAGIVSPARLVTREIVRLVVVMVKEKVEDALVAVAAVESVHAARTTMK